MAKTHDAPALPIEFTIGDRTYELVPFLKEGERYVKGDVMVERAKELDANLGAEDGQFILEHQAEIPQEFQRKFFLVFTAWRNPSNPLYVAFLFWYDDRWYLHWLWLGLDFFENDRLVRCRT